MSDKSRHAQLIRAGWIYDSVSDRYRKPQSASDGTAKMYNLDAAYQQFQADQQPTANESPPASRQADPRRQEPQ